MAATVRLFIGSFLEASGIADIARWRESQDAWATDCDTRVRWVADDQLHLTWQFLGDTPQEDVSRLQLKLTEAMVDCPAFELTFNRLAIWPHVKKPQVLVWVADLNAGCQQVAEAIQAACGDAREHAFQPHITLARFKPNASFRRKAMALPTTDLLSPLSWLVQDVHLVESILKPAGAEYRLIQRWALHC